MDPLETASQEADNTLSMISDLRGNAEPVSETPAAAPAEQPAEVPAEVVEDDSEARRNALLREIAIDPGLSRQYVQQLPVPQQQPEPQSPALPFDEFSFDPSNPAHQQALFDARLQEVGGPLFEKIDSIAQRFAQEDQQRQAAHMQQVADHANQKTVELLDTYVPGFNAIVAKASKGEDWSAQEEALFTLAVNMESQFFQAYPQAVYDLNARAQIAQQIGPILNEKAKALGLVAQPKAALTPEVQQQMKREMYVESSNAVPANTAGTFDKAHQAGDTFGMIRALRAK